MRRPLIGITCFSFQSPASHAAIGILLRSGVNQDYVDAVMGAGGAPVCIPLGLDDEALRTIYSTLDGLLLPGGDDVGPHRYGHEPHPALGTVDEKRDDLELTLAAWAVRDDLPVLGICRGIQVLAVAAGGTLWQDVPSQVGHNTLHDVRDFGRDHRCHEVDVEPDSHFAQAVGSTRLHVNSFHHQAVLDLPPGFMVSARADDGVIEGIESLNAPFAVGVQCHPEGMWRTSAPEFAGLFRAFVEAAADHSAEPRRNMQEAHAG